MQLKENLMIIRDQIQDRECQLVAVTKTHPIPVLEEAYALGLRVFGENKAQELLTKREALPKDIEWHMIGHLQSNKVKQIAPFVALIHSVDSLSLLTEINKQGQKIGRTIACLLQVHISQEETKFGFDVKELEQLILNEQLKLFPYAEIKGMMGMATHTNDEEVIRKEFQGVYRFYESFKSSSLLPKPWTVLSTGMSNDYLVALAEGSNMIRVGSSLFGNRQYPA